MGLLLLASRAAAADLPRLLVLTDIGGDPDDQQAMVRLMVYVNEFEIEGLIASASGIPGELKQKITRPDLIREIVQAYGQVRTNLAAHAPGYPEASDLLAKIKTGNPNRGLEAIGEGHDTEGSRWILAAAGRNDRRPLNIAIWGGQTDLAQALWRARRDRGDAGLRELAAQLRIYDIGDQDRIADWIGREFPGLSYVLGQAPAGRDKREAVFRGMYLGGEEALTSRAWLDAHVREKHGPLGALYPPKTWTAPNPHGALKEGDTPSWFFFLQNGINDSAHPDWGGWGGRFARGAGGWYRDAKDTVQDVSDARCSVWRWRPAFQNEFAARMDWCATGDRSKANHPPVIVLNGDGSKRVVELSVQAGGRLALTSEGSSDPDGQVWETTWFIYPEAGSIGDGLRLDATSGESTGFEAPRVGKTEILHVVLQLKDGGSPPLVAFRRAVITIRP